MTITSSILSTATHTMLDNVCELFKPRETIMQGANPCPRTPAATSETIERIMLELFVLDDTVR